MTQEFNGLDVLRLEVEVEPDGLVNLLPNPDGRLGDFGWVLPVTGTSLDRLPLPGPEPRKTALRYKGVASVSNYLTSESMPVTPGTYVAAGWINPAAEGPQILASRGRLQWLDAAGNVISQGAQTGYVARFTRGTIAAALVPGGISHVRLRLDVFENVSGSYVFPSTAVGWAFRPDVATASTAAELVSFADLEPRQYLNILGPTHTITVSRGALDVGTLSATILDADLDPAAADTISPGRYLWLRALVDGLWESVYEGRITEAKTSYAKAKGGSLTDRGAVRIDLVASDNITRLANQAESRSVAQIAHLPWLLSDTGVPWLVNGHGGQIPAQQVVAINDNTSVLDQVALTRDTNLGYAWVDRNNALQVWDPLLLDDTVAATFSDTTGDLSYSAIDVSYDVQDCINSVAVEFVRYQPVAGVSTNISYGPYVDAASIDRFGARSATFTIVGAAENALAIGIYADVILAANATPLIRCNSLTMPVRNADELRAAALLDLYSLIDVAYEDRVDGALRITGIDHTISPGKWLTTYTFARPTSVAAPTLIPAPSMPPPADPEPDPDTGWQALTLATGWTGAVHYRVIGGVVYLRGQPVRTSGSSATIATLPVGVRPAVSLGYTVRNGNGTAVCNLAIGTTGAINTGSLNAANPVYLDAIAYPLG
ncbi:hypothetical protein [Nocardioides alcanivorans]|uniref:hypothetical protein n=1 Tax=Nocardioides alcanivorans TaxID=2897352 RepID=UPI001F2F5C19|nr:hypothetical protein [Nocardioides alcanivorans]